MRMGFWVLGRVLEVIGLLALPLGLFIGLSTGDLGAEYALWGMGLLAFFTGTALRRTLGGDRG